MHWTDLLHKR